MGQCESELVAYNIVGAGALPLLLDVLRSENSEILELACGILGQVASHPILVEVIVSTNACAALAAVLRYVHRPLYAAFPLILLQ
jgi:hypothetical protein